MLQERPRKPRAPFAMAIIAGGILAVLVSYRMSCHHYDCELTDWLYRHAGEAALWWMIGAFLTATVLYCVAVFRRP
jgi:hypothetical protein